MDQSHRETKGERIMRTFTGAEARIIELRQVMDFRRVEVALARKQVERAQTRLLLAVQAAEEAQAEVVTLAVEPVRDGAPIALVAEMAGVSVARLRKALNETKVP